jgi:GTP1/Obg family GTP-binding protein
MKQQQVDALKELFKDANEVDKEIQKCKDHLDLLHGRSRLRLQLAVNSLGTAKGHLLEILQGLELLIDEAEEGVAHCRESNKGRIMEVIEKINGEIETLQDEIKNAGNKEEQS